jgi:hypothetical protein
MRIEIFISILYFNILFQHLKYNYKLTREPRYSPYSRNPISFIPSLTSIKRHLWYLTEELVIFCYSMKNWDHLHNLLWQKKLFSTPRPDVFNVRKQKFPTIDDNNLSFSSSLIGPKSWLIFALLGLPSSQNWLQFPQKYWEQMFDYRFARSFCVYLQVVNDCAFLKVL